MVKAYQRISKVFMGFQMRSSTDSRWMIATACHDSSSVPCTRL
uniref:Uncharacterized protein n=1 Tax=Arundo donax TaxID=35708 RepID=A0A0A8ZSI6_ARUDO